MVTTFLPSDSEGNMDLLDIEIIDWAKFNPRSDRSITIWFRMENDFFTDQKNWSWTDNQRLLFLFLLCEASKIQSSKIKIDANMVAVLRKTTPQKILQDLEELGRQGVLRPPTGGLKPDEIPATRQDSTEQYTTINLAQKPKAKQPAASPDGFAEFYSGYPRKVGRTAAMKAWRRIASDPGFSLEDLLAARRRYRETLESSGTEPKFVQHPATFLNSWRDWLDPSAGSSDLKAASDMPDLSHIEWSEDPKGVA